MRSFHRKTSDKSTTNQEVTVSELNYTTNFSWKLKSTEEPQQHLPGYFPRKMFLLLLLSFALFPRIEGGEWPFLPPGPKLFTRVLLPFFTHLVLSSGTFWTTSNPTSDPQGLYWMWTKRNDGKLTYKESMSTNLLMPPLEQNLGYMERGVLERGNADSHKGLKTSSTRWDRRDIFQQYFGQKTNKQK